MDLEDFAFVQKAAHEFLEHESPDGRLDVLLVNLFLMADRLRDRSRTQLTLARFNNAGTGGRKDAPLGVQGNEYHFTTNALGPFFSPVS